MLKRILTLLLTLIGVFHIPVLAQFYNLHNISTSNGMLNNTVWCMLQDKNGFLWFGTSAGLDRFDGKSFIHFTKENGLPSNEVLEIHYDKFFHRIYIQTFSNNLCYLDIESGRIYNSMNNGSLREIERFINKVNYSIELTDSLYIFFWTNEIALKVNKKNLQIIEEFKSEFHSLYLKFFYKGDTLYKFCTTPDTLVRISYYDKNGTPKPFKKFYNSRTGFFKLSSLRNGKTLFYDKDNNIFYFDQIEFDIKHLIKAKSDISGLIVDEDSLLWYGKNDGVWVHNLKNKSEPPSHLLKGLIITAILKDQANNYWISTASRGIFQIKNKNIINLYSDENNHSPVHHITKFQNKIIVGHFDNSYSIYKKMLSKKYHYFNQQKFCRTISSFIYNDELILVNEFKLYNFSKKQVLLNENAIKDVTLLHDNSIAVGTVHGLSIYKSNKSGIELIAHPFKTRVTCEIEADSDKILIGTMTGLYELNLRSYRIVKNNFFIGLKAKINDIYRNRDGEIWILTSENGIWKYGKKNVQLFKNSGINYANVKVVVETSDSLTLVGTDYGIFTFIKEKGTLYGFKQILIDESFGINSNQIFDMKVFNDTIYVGTGKGLSLIPLKEIFSNRPLKIYIKEFYINDMLYPNRNNSIEMQTSDKIKLRLNTFTYDQSNQLTYVYKLNNTKHFSTFYENTLELFGLKNDSYTVNIFAFNRFDPKKISNLIKIKLKVKPQYYNTLFFNFLLTFLIILLIYLIIYSGGLQKSFKIIGTQETDAKLKRMELTALRSQLDPHFIFNALNSIKNYLPNHEIKDSERYLDQFADLIRKTLDYSRIEKISINAEIEHLISYLKLESLRFNSNFKWKITLAQGCNFDNLKIPSMMIQPFVENCIKHGQVGNLKYEGFIDILFSMNSSDQIVCRVTDNGVGYRKKNSKQNIRNYDKSDNKNNGIHAIQIIKDRFRIYNSINKKKISFTISDRIMDHGGTIVLIQLPKL